MDHELIQATEIIRSYVLQLIESSALTITNHNEEKKSNLEMSNVLAFIYKDYTIGMNGCLYSVYGISFRTSTSI